MTLKPVYDNSYALVVGIDEFRAAQPLDTARYGAEAIASILLQRYRFDVVEELYDSEATRANIEDAYADLRAAMGPDDRLVVYWAGHGFGVQGQNRSIGFLVAHDSNLEKRTRLIRMRDLADSNLTKAKHAFVILDTCHSGFAVTYESPRAVALPPDRRLAMKQFLTRKAYQVLASANPQETATDAGLMGGHTPFTGSLLAALEGDPTARAPVTNLLTASSVAEYVRNHIAAFSGNWQGPQTGILPGDGGGVLVWELPGALDALPERLRRVLESADPDVRYTGLDSAEKLLNDPLLQVSVREVIEDIAIRDAEEDVRRHAFEILRRFPDASSVPPAYMPLDLVSPPKIDEAAEHRERVAEIDLSGRIDDIHNPTVITLVNDQSTSLMITAQEKEALLSWSRLFGVPRWSPTRRHYHVFAALIFLLIADHIGELDTVFIDHEYQGHESKIRAWILERLRERGIVVEKKVIQFTRLPADSLARRISTEVLRVEEPPQIIVNAQQVRQLLSN